MRSAKVSNKNYILEIEKLWKKTSVNNRPHSFSAQYLLIDYTKTFDRNKKNLGAHKAIEDAWVVFSFLQNYYLHISEK